MPCAGQRASAAGRGAGSVLIIYARYASAGTPRANAMLVASASDFYARSHLSPSTGPVRFFPPSNLNACKVFANAKKVCGEWRQRGKIHRRRLYLFGSESTTGRRRPTNAISSLGQHNF
jgi:hypothetical protein